LFPSFTSLRARDRDLPRREESLEALTGIAGTGAEESLVLDMDRADLVEAERSGPRRRLSLSGEEADESEETGLLLWCVEEGSWWAEDLLRGGRRLFATGCSFGTDGGGATGANALSVLMGRFIQLDTEVASEG
jgi:hypothetical protein